MKVKFKRLNDKAVMPTKAHPTDAGFDLTATSRTVDEYGNIVYGTGLALEIPEGYVGLLFPRSSICKKDLALSNSTGICDCHYRGEIMFKFKPAPKMWTEHGEAIAGVPLKPTDYAVGERIGQLVIMPIPEIEFEEADELTETDRGVGGYGSTGR